MRVRLYYLIETTKYTICAVSMILTALFALSFSTNNDIEVSVLGGNYFITVLAVTIGICIDLCKYLFWYRFNTTVLRLISLLLMIFSWLASVAFFASEDNHSMEEKRKLTSSYLAHQARIDFIKQDIENKERLLNKRLNSQYHKQWDKSENIVNEITTLNNELYSLLKIQSSVGQEEVMTNSVTRSFYQGISNATGVSHSVIALACYGILALLIELCSLGIISLSSLYGKQIQYEKNKSFKTADKKWIKKQKTLLRRDIIAGRIKPILRYIKSDQYGLSKNDIKSVLLQLKQEGVLVYAARNSLKLAKPIE